MIQELRPQIMQGFRDPIVQVLDQPESIPFHLAPSLVLSSLIVNVILRKRAVALEKVVCSRELVTWSDAINGLLDFSEEQA